VDEFLFGLLVALLEVIGEFLIELVFGLAAETLSAAFSRLKETSPMVSAIGLAIAGAAAGLLSAWLFPKRLIVTRVVLPGVSLLVAPIVTGVAMGFLGKRLRGIGRYPSSLATFRGGVLFAFPMALIRWWLVSK
jgi:hypothetical protein